jgi:hypothetical protein
MTMTAAACALSVPNEAQQELYRTAGLSSSSHKSVIPAEVVVAANGVAIHETARPLRFTSNSVCTWRDSFRAVLVEGRGQVSLGPRRKSWLPEAIIATVAHGALHTLPAGSAFTLSRRPRP